MSIKNSYMSKYSIIVVDKILINIDLELIMVYNNNNKNNFNNFKKYININKISQLTLIIE